MSDKEARAVGAGAYVTGGGKEFLVRPLSFRELAEVQREAIRYHRREYVQTYSDNKDLLGDDFAEVLRSKLDEVAKWDVGDLPKKKAYDTSNVKINQKVRKLLAGVYGEALPVGEVRLRALLNAALDGGTITVEQVASATGQRPRMGWVSYDTWWITADYHGMLTFVWIALKGENKELTKESLNQWSFQELAEAARTVERITAPAVGNM